MRTTRLALSWSAIVLMSGVGTGCVFATQSAPEGFRADDAIAQTTPEERRQLRDSAAAQQVADEVGPRVTVRADFDFAGGSREVQATFHMYDDAYVIVGHLDAAGRLKIVFPSEPGDDGFVRGDKIYHVPSFFAGFVDEYAWRRNDYRYSAHTVASRRDSYDAGLGYVFVIASWRPMRLDRITDGDRWQTYNDSDVGYMTDPRDAVEVDLLKPRRAELPRLPRHRHANGHQPQVAVDADDSVLARHPLGRVVRDAHYELQVRRFDALWPRGCAQQRAAGQEKRSEVPHLGVVPRSESNTSAGAISTGRTAYLWRGS